MAKQIGSQLDLQKIPVIGLVAQQMASPGPTSPVNGQLWYDTTNNITKVYDNGSWIAVVQTGLAPTGSAGGDLTGNYPNPTLAASVVTTGKILDGTILLGDMDPTASNAAAGTPSLRKLGTGATDATAGNDSRLSDSRAPSGAAGGDLTGSTYPNPVVANLAITAAKMALATITDAQVAAANKDGVAGTASLRTLGSGAQQALAGNTRLDQIAAPTASVSMNSQALTNLPLATNNGDAASKAYVDSFVQGLAPKDSVRLASTANLSLTGAATIDGFAVANGDRILAKDQTTPAQNGIYQANTAGGWTRTQDMDNWLEVPGASVWVEQGTVNQDTSWVCVTDQGGTLNTTAITWVQSSGAGQITDGIGLLKTGNTLDVRLDNSSIEAPADVLQVKAAGITNAMLAGGIDLTAKVIGILPVGNLGSSPNNNTYLKGAVSGSSSWATTATLKTDLALTKSDVGLANVPNTDATNAANISSGIMDLARLGTTPVSGDFLKAGGATGQADWAALTKTDVGLANVDNTSDVNKPVSTATQTALNAKAGKFAGLLGALSAGVETLITHSLGTQDVVASFRDASTNKAIDFDWRAASTTQIGVTADIAYSANAIRAVVVG